MKYFNFEWINAWIYFLFGFCFAKGATVVEVVVMVLGYGLVKLLVD